MEIYIKALDDRIEDILYEIDEEYKKAMSGTKEDRENFRNKYDEKYLENIDIMFNELFYVSRKMQLIDVNIKDHYMENINSAPDDTKKKQVYFDDDMSESDDFF